MSKNSEKVKVVHILEGFLGGTRTYMCNVLPELVENHFDVTFICSLNRSCPGDSVHLSRLRKKGVKVHVIGMHRKINPFLDILSFFQILRILTKNRFDIIHTHCSKAGALGRVAAFVAGLKIVLHSPHCFAFLRCKGRCRKYLYLKLEKLLGKLTSRIIAVSESEKETVAQFRIVSADKCVAVSNGLPNDGSFQEENDCTKKYRNKATLGLDLNKRVVTTVCRLVEYKGVLRFLKAAQLSQTKDLVFVVAGSGPQKAILEDFICQNNLSEKVTLLGHVQNIELVYAISNAVVLCSDAEGQPYVLLEAMRAKCPVIATAVTGNRELVLDGVTGFLANPEASSIAHTIDNLLADESKANRYVEKAYACYRSKHTLERQVTELMNIYMNCMDENTGQYEKTKTKHELSK